MITNVYYILMIKDTVLSLHCLSFIYDFEMKQLQNTIYPLIIMLLLIIQNIMHKVRDKPNKIEN